MDQATDSYFALEQERLGPGRCRIAVRGALDLFSAPELKRRLLEVVEVGTKGLVLDLCETSFLDSTGLGALLTAHRRLDARGGRMIIVLSEPRVEHVLEITGLDSILEFARTRAEAVAAFDRPAIGGRTRRPGSARR